MKGRPLPIGVDNFRELIEKEYYYVDKTAFIKELLDRKGKVNLFTRPRRFGKSLNLSMLQCFFERRHPGGENLFRGLAIMKAGEAYTSHMSQYPVISVSLKSMKQSNYELAYMQLKKSIGEEFRRHDEVLETDKLTASEKERFQALRDVQGRDSDYLDALWFLSACLKKCYGKNTIILLDEYDVPLENAYFNGFYEQMVSLIRSLYESALKTNENLEFAVITGCLRISRESIFTGLNNLNVISITNPTYGEHFGFTQRETEEMLAFYGRQNHKDEMKKWYDGYLFGNTEVYNPWSVINYVNQIWADEKALPQPFWSNTSSNSIIRTLIDRADMRVKQELEDLIQGKSIEKPIHEDITYEDIEPDRPKEMLWSFLFFTGYLKKTGERLEDGVRYISMSIPNQEVRYIYKNTVLSWFEQKIKKRDLQPFYSSLAYGRIPELEGEISRLLREGISFYDSREAFYHGFLMGLFNGMEDYYTYSNRESGEGRYDICLKSPEVERPVIILELKLASSFGELEKRSQEAVNQILIKHYQADLFRDGYTEALCYGIAFYKKSCRVSLIRRRIGQEKGH